MCIFGRAIRDFIPIHPGKYQPHPTWRETMSNREEALRNRHMRAAERLSAHTRPLPPLVISDHVRIQNQTGPHPTKWDKTGIVVEVRQFDQYVVRVDGSGRVTLRNRKFLRKYLPVITRTPVLTVPGPITPYTPKNTDTVPAALPQVDQAATPCPQTPPDLSNDSPDTTMQPTPLQTSKKATQPTPQPVQESRPTIVEGVPPWKESASPPVNTARNENAPVITRSGRLVKTPARYRDGL
jgi:hypothetical protein